MEKTVQDISSPSKIKIYATIGLITFIVLLGILWMSLNFIVQSKIDAGKYHQAWRYAFVLQKVQPSLRNRFTKSAWEQTLAELNKPSQQLGIGQTYLSVLSKLNHVYIFLPGDMSNPLTMLESKLAPYYKSEVKPKERLRAFHNFYHYSKSVRFEHQKEFVTFCKYLEFDAQLYPIFLAAYSGDYEVIYQTAKKLKNLPSRSQVPLEETIPGLYYRSLQIPLYQAIEEIMLQCSPVTTEDKETLLAGVKILYEILVAADQKRAHYIRAHISEEAIQKVGQWLNQSL